jgi:hypothetical protein
MGWVLDLMIVMRNPRTEPAVVRYVDSAALHYLRSRQSPCGDIMSKALPAPGFAAEATLNRAFLS